MKNLSVHLVALNPGLYSLALGYLESNLRSSPTLLGRVDVETTIVDLDEAKHATFDLTDLAYRLTRYRPHLIGFSVFMWNHAIVAELARLVASLCPQSTLVFGGAQFDRVTELWDDFPDDGIIVTGEGEVVLATIAQRMLDGEDFDGIPGIGRKLDGRWQIGTPPCSLDLDRITSPILDGSLSFPSGDRLPSYSTSRGCIYRCCYCGWGDGSGVRYFPKERVEKELEILASKAYERYWISDCLLGFDEDRSVWLLHKLSRWSHRPRFGFETRPEFLTPRVLRALRPLHLEFLAIGIQAQDLKAAGNLDRAHGEVRVFEVLDRLTTAIYHKQRVHLDLIVGLPGDSIGDAFESVDRLHARYPEFSLIVRRLQVLPGTPLGDIAREQKWILHDCEHSHDLVQNEELSIEDLMMLKDLSDGLGFLQRRHVRPHQPRLDESTSYARFAVAVGEYLRQQGLDSRHRFDGDDWMSARLGIKTKRVLREILASAAASC